MRPSIYAEEYEFWWEKVMQVCDRDGRRKAQVHNILKPVMEKAGYELFVSVLRKGCRYGLG